MSYVIEYEPALKKKYCMKHRVPLRKKAVVFGVIVICISILIFTPLRAALLNWLIPGDPAVTGNAFDTLVGELARGADFGSAVETFCVTIISNA